MVKVLGNKVSVCQLRKKVPCISVAAGPGSKHNQQTDKQRAALSTDNWIVAFIVRILINCIIIVKLLCDNFKWYVQLKSSEVGFNVGRLGFCQLHAIDPKMPRLLWWVVSVSATLHWAVWRCDSLSPWHTVWHGQCPQHTGTMTTFSVRLLCLRTMYLQYLQYLVSSARRNYHDQWSSEAADTGQ